MRRSGDALPPYYWRLLLPAARSWLLRLLPMACPALPTPNHVPPPHPQALGWALYSSALVACLYLLFQAVAGVAYW